MSARDIIHNSVKNALIKDGWIITHDPFTIQYKELKLSADLGAERPIAAQRQGKKIVVEIKSFIGRSAVQDFKLALGQYNLYLGLLEVTAPDRQLYLAISDIVYLDLFEGEAIRLILNRFNVLLVVVNVVRQEVVRWID